MTVFTPSSPSTKRRKLHKQVGPRCLVCGLQFPGRWPDHLEHQGKLDFRIVELLSTLPLAKFCWDGGCLDDLDAVVANPMPGSHLCVHLFNSTIQSSVTELLVHVVIASSTLISQPDAIILDLCRVLLKNLQANQITHMSSD